MMIEYTRREAVKHYGAVRGEFGWILDDNVGMRSIAETIEASVNKVYRIYEKAL
jgi:transposase-like protein